MDSSFWCLKVIAEALNVTQEMFIKYWQEDKVQLNDTLVNINSNK